MGLFDNRVEYKPFEYPEYYTEGWLKQAQAFWLHTEISMSGDVKDWNERLTDKEKSLVGNILLGLKTLKLSYTNLQRLSALKTWWHTKGTVLVALLALWLFSVLSLRVLVFTPLLLSCTRFKCGTSLKELVSK